MKVGSQQAEDTGPDHNIPEDAEYAVMVAGQVTVMKADRYSEYLPEGADPDEGERVVFEPGDGVSLELLKETWRAFEDNIAFLDEDGVRIDSPSEVERQNSGLASRALNEFRGGL